MDFIRNLRKAEWYNVIISVLFIVIGIILIKSPEQVLQIVSIIMGVAFLALGIIRIIKYLNDKRANNELYFDMFFGLIAVITGLIVIFCTSAIEAIFRIIIGVWIIFSGCNRFALVKQLKEANLKEWIVSLVLAVLMILCGVYMIVTPGTVVAVIGGIIIAYSIINLIQSIMCIKNSKVIIIEK